MKTIHVFAVLLLALSGAGIVHAAPESPALSQRVAITPEIRKAFASTDAIEVREITGTAAKFQVGGTYRVTGVCRQSSLKHAVLYLGNTAEPGPAAITPAAGSSLTRPLPGGATEFTYTVTLLRPGLLHLSIYDLDNPDGQDNVASGVYLGDVVLPR